VAKTLSVEFLPNLTVAQSPPEVLGSPEAQVISSGIKSLSREHHRKLPGHPSSVPDVQKSIPWIFLFSNQQQGRYDV